MDHVPARRRPHPPRRRWSVVRTAGLTARVADGADQFAGPDRSAAVTVFTDDVPGRTPEDFLAVLLDGAPDRLPAQRLTEPLRGGLRHAFWMASDDRGGERHEFYGFTESAVGTAAGLCRTHEGKSSETRVHLPLPR
ncbi:hypothetical protein [Streptomyces sp. NBC_00887]|uniref:hypothetical protein n=1 Tax=Streptomyces sp. NBC_00887 TaxID=2975859 RepID=UPI0038702762|nr:hypothetical protein OG844_13200 [Streptomyces sp. NBC_00887]